MAGGGSSGTQQTTATQTAEPWSGQQPYLTDVFQQAQNQYQSDQPAYYPGSTVTPFAPQQEAALQAGEQRALYGSPLNFAAQNQAMQTLGGDYLTEGNPYMGALTESLSNRIRPQVDSAFAGANRGGSAGHAEAFSRGLADAVAPHMFGSYEAERARQMGAMQAAPGLAANDYFDIQQLGNIGAQRQGMQQQILGDDINRYNFAQNINQAKLVDYAGLISGNYGGQVQSTQAQPLYSNGLANAFGGAASGAAAGMTLGPWGAVAGGVLGGLGGLLA